MMKKYFFFLMLTLPLSGITQVTDDFSDGNFTSNPPWTGDEGSFEINSSGQLHLRTTGAGTVVLATRNLLVSDTEWDFWIKLSFNTSANNYARVYLVADNTEIMDDVKGYYLQVGGSNDSIQFVRQNGPVHHVLFKASNAYTGNSVNLLRIKVIHDARGTWHLFSDNTGNHDFSEEGACDDDSITQTAAFGLYCKFTASNSTKFYFDDIYIGPVIIDSVAPEILSVTAGPENRLTVKFSEPVGYAAATQSSNYFVPGHGAPSESMRDANDPGTVILEFEQGFASGSCDTLFIFNMVDLNGNSSGEMAKSFCFYRERSFDVVISEIMADPNPQTGLPDAEYVELFNRTPFPVSLKDWSLEAGSTKKVFPDAEIQPNGFLTLTKGNLLSFFGPSLDLFTSSSTLANDGSTLTLKNKENKIIHSVSYSPDWYGNSLKENGGWSLEIIDPSNPCGCADNWGASTDPLGGTPGNINSIDLPNPDTLRPRMVRAVIESDSSARILFSEPIDSSSFASPEEWVMENSDIRVENLKMAPPAFNSLVLQFSSPLIQGTAFKLIPPEGVKDCSGNLLVTGTSVFIALPETISGSDIIVNEILPDPISYGERFIELYNRSGKVLDLRNLVLLDPDTASGEEKKPVSISEDGFLVFPGKYVVLTRDPQDIIKSYRVPDPDCMIRMSSMPSMNDDNGTVILAKKNDLAIIDKVTYTEDMNFPLLASPEGVSLERIDPNGPSGSSSNWHSASGNSGYATPGYLNSQNLVDAFADDSVSLFPGIFSPDNDGKDDVLTIQFKSGKTGYVANIAVFSSSGRFVRQLVRNEMISPESFFSWDGTTENHARAAIGIYIVRIELFAPDGTVKCYKKPVVLGGRL